MFSGYCKEPFTVEMCESEFKNSSGEVTKKKYPDLTIRQLNVKVKDINQLIGINLSAEAIVGLLTKVGLDAKANSELYKSNRVCSAVLTTPVINLLPMINLQF